MTMFGARLEDLSALADQLRATTIDIEDGSDDAVRITSDVIQAVSDAADAARDQITQAVQAISSAVTAAARQAEGTEWVGANRDRFVEAAANFDGAIGDAQVATVEMFGDFRVKIGELSAQLDSYVTDFGRAMGEAREHSTSMATAVDAQRNNLEAVMNEGLSVA